MKTEYYNKYSIIHGTGKKLSIIPMLMVVFLLFSSCQSAQTRKELEGKWAYKGGGTYLSFDVRYLHQLNAEYRKKRLNEGYSGCVWIYSLREEKIGSFYVNGRNVTLCFKDGYNQTLRLSENHRLYAVDGSEYIKVRD